MEKVGGGDGGGGEMAVDMAVVGGVGEVGWR